MLIAIDGPAGAGKSTVARAVARALGFTYLDSGALYRCVALRSLASPNEAPGRLALDASIEFDPGVGGVGQVPPDSSAAAPVIPMGRVLLDGRDVTAAIRAPEVSEAASFVAADPRVREALLARQRELIAQGDWVAEGRDIGTVVAPDAEVKVYLTASPQERARRRAGELGADPKRVLAEQTMRDERDASREHSPLAPAADAVLLDTTGLSVAQVVERIAALALESRAHSRA